jgi:YVTN family beta-propeller protein
VKLHTAQPHSIYPRGFLGLGLIVTTLGLTACPPTDNPNPPPPPPPAAQVSKRPSKSSAVAVSNNDKLIVQVNPDDDSVSFINTATDTRTAKLAVGNEPASVVIGPDDKTAFVANRADATVMKITGIDTGNPSVTATVQVGSEPTGIALSPTGAKLVVTEFAEGRVSLIDTASMTVTTSKPVYSPRAVAISNNGDTNDNDEKVVVTEFYGTPTGQEATDSSRIGKVDLFNLNGLSEAGTVSFDPISPGAFVPTATSPNQLASVAIFGDKFFVTAVGASPDGTPKFNENVFPLLLIGQVSTASKIATISIADAIKAQVTASPKFFMADLIDVATVGDSILYLLGRGADAVQRVVLTGGSSVTLGSTTPPVQQIDLLGGGCKNPIGLVTPNDTSDSKKMYVNCWVSRTATVVALDQQKAVTKIQSADLPAIGSVEAKVNNGERFYFTGRGRWSQEAWSSCGTCHPDGLSDNITWRFPTGPRQSISMDGTFSHGFGTQKERILNWTAERDEIIDFERNTRLVSGGLGAVTTGTCATPPANDISGETILNLNPNNVGVKPPATDDKQGLLVQLGLPVQEVQDGIVTGPSCVKDWDDIDAFVKTIRPPKGRRTLDAASVTRGEAAFREGSCQNCHGGPGFSLSRRFYTPSSATNDALSKLDFVAPGHTKMIQAELASVGDPIAPAQVACVLRELGTFGALNPAETATLEKRQGNVLVAQGQFSGFNIPSLYGLSLGAPYLHHGQAKTLNDLFSDPRWNLHLLSGNNTFTLTPQKRLDLISYLFSIDATTAEVAPANGSDKCPANFKAP